MKYIDSFCVIESYGENRAIYADLSFDCVDMPLIWAKKAVDLLKQGNISKGLHYIDMAKKVKRG